MTDRIVGLLPVGGEGTRLAQPAPKPLLPTITPDGQIIPLYRHALAQLEVVTAETYALIHETSCGCLRRLGIPVIETAERALGGALGVAGRILAEQGDPLVAMAFPDSVWRLAPGRDLRTVVDHVRGDGALALFDSGADELDNVLLDGERVAGVVAKEAGMSGMVRGWGAWVVRASALAGFTADERDGPQLGRLDMGWAYLGSYVDLGTPARYVRAHDMRNGGEW